LIEMNRSSFSGVSSLSATMAIAWPPWRPARRIPLTSPQEPGAFGASAVTADAAASGAETAFDFCRAAP
jgi:hypothetical protein